jgi:hypothetical protein
MATINNTYTQAFRTTCIPEVGDRLGDIIPSEYIGQKLEIIVLPQLDNLKYNTDTDALNRLCGMFKNTNLLSSDDFSKNKEQERKLEEEKFKHE